MPAYIYAEDIGNYWKTSQAQTETWLDKCKKEIVNAGGKVLRSAVFEEGDKTVIALEFTFGKDSFRSTWDVLPSRTGNIKAAKIQAATMMYHDIKDSCVKAKVRGFRRAFAEYLILPEGNQTFGDLVKAQSLTDQRLLLAPPSEVIEGEFK